MKIKEMDHFLLTVHSISASCDFYNQVLGMEIQRFSGNRVALIFDHMKINLHQIKHEYEPKADKPTPGSADL